MQKEILEALHTEKPSLDITQIAIRKPRYTKKHPIPMEKLIALRKKGLTHNEIAAIIGCARETVTRKLLEADIEGLEDFERFEPTILAHQRRRIIGSITDEDLKKASLSQKVISTAVLIEKQRLLENKSTSNVSLQISEEHRRIAEEVIDRIGLYEIERVRGENPG